MPMWRCPHCGTPQPEAARCWVCRRSSTTCSTCRHFRQSLAASVGYCGLDPRRAPLLGTEHRGCWEAAARVAPAIEAPHAPDADAVDPSVSRLRPGGRPRAGGRARPGVVEGFVPIEDAASGPRMLRPFGGPPMPPPAVIELVESWADRTTLFGDGEA